MAISGPKGSTPTHRGWMSAKGELLKAQKIGKAAITEWFMANTSVPQAATEEQVQDMITEGKIQAAIRDAEFHEALREVEKETDDIVKDFNEDGTIDELESMSKKELEAHGITLGIEIDRRKSKDKMIEQLKEELDS
jgi:hypothetical protein